MLKKHKKVCDICGNNIEQSVNLYKNVIKAKPEFIPVKNVNKKKICWNCAINFIMSSKEAEMRCANEGCIYHTNSQNNNCLEYRDLIEQLCDEFIEDSCEVINENKKMG